VIRLLTYARRAGARRAHGRVARRRRQLSAAALLLLAGAAAADSPPIAIPRPDTFVARLEALALLQTLNAELLSHDSATLTLEHWCGAHRLAAPARVSAARVAMPDKPPSIEQRRDLNVSDSESVRYRHVRLSCGPAVLSEADNWYVPGRLSADMNRQLETSDTPFGKVVQPLNFRRHTLAADLLWHPLPAGWEMAPDTPDGGATLGKPRAAPLPLTIPSEVLRHRALLSLPDGTPFSEVIETYTDAVLNFPAQSSPN
jgi:chorismate-pyruvate lyase